MNMILRFKSRLMALLTALFVGSATSWASSGALNGVFTINENNDKVVFSQGNLQYQASTDTWRFAENQWSFVGYQTEGNVYENGTKCDNGSISATYSGWIDMFGWGTSGWNNGNTNYMPWSSAYSSWSSYGPPCECDLTGDYANADWGVYNAISNGGNQPGQWRTMSSSEWVYLLGSRNTSSGIRFAKAIVNGVKGLLLLPDSWSASVYSLENPNVGDADYEPNTITLDDWNNTLEPAGAVFLPAGGARGLFGFAGVGTFGEYWTTTSGTTSNAYELYFGEGAYIPDRSYHRCDGRLVRLVQPATATSFIDQYFTIESLVDNNTITLTIGSAVTQEQLQSVSYSTDNGATWTTTAIDNTTQTISVVANAGDKVLWKGEGNRYAIGYGNEYLSTFSATGQHEISGNIMSLLFGDDFASQTAFPEGSSYTFFYLFFRNTKLTSAANLVLPVTTLANRCYENMFSGCTSLTEAPALPAMSLAPYCYSYMFNGCTSLTEAPTLPAMSLAPYCYECMFYGCASLTEAPALPATSLAQSCYRVMFYGCTSLAEAPALPATTLATECYYAMFSGCTSLAEAPALPATTLATGCYNSMFSSCTLLAEAPALPTTTLASQCYYAMFFGCTSLTEAPALPATTLADYCYQSMFNGCTSLTEAPALPAMSLAPYCYRYMFNGCTSLTEAPALPAMSLAPYCYRYMFYGCTSLTEAPALPATTLAQYCYDSMFHGCTSLTEAPALPATSLAYSCYRLMFGGCTSLTEAPALPATTLAQDCYNQMFYDCTSLNEVTCLATDISAENCTTDWLSGVATTGTFHKNVVMEDWPTNNASGIPTGWNVEEVSIVCPITVAANPTEGGTVSGAGDYYYGSTCTLTAEPSEGWAFVNWSKEGTIVSSDNPYSFGAIGGDYTASFMPLEGNHVIGEGNGTNDYLPSYSNYMYTLSQQIYNADEIGESGNIKSIAFFNAGAEKTRTYDIYLVHTEKAVFESNTDWIAVTGANRVYSGSVTMAHGCWTTIAFDTPFAYDGLSNLAVVIDDNSGYYTDAPHMSCRVFDTESAQAIRVYNYGTNYNPYSPSGYTGTLHNVKNQVIFGFERYTVTATANPAEGGTVTGGGLLLAGSTASLAATANSIFEFVNWTENGEVVSTANPYEFEVTEDRNLVANFEMGPITNHWTSITGTQYNMTMSGLIYIDGEAQTSTALEIGAFCGEQCRGSALAQFFPPTGEYVVSLTVVSNQLNGETITFRLYDHISQQEYPTECINSVTFNANDNLGTMGDWYPFAFYYAQETTALANGWTWWSTSVELSGIDGLTMLEESLGHNGLLIKSFNKFVQNYYPSTGYDYWFGQLTSADFNNESSYMIQTSASCEVTMSGTYANPSNHPIQLYPDWTWIGYPCGTQQNTNSAFADFTPTNKDMVKGQYAFSTYYDNYGWFPEFALTPGQGYMYQSLAPDNRTLTFANGSKADPQTTEVEERYWRNNVHDFANNMNVIAVVTIDGEEKYGDDLELGAFVNGECRGSAVLMYFHPTDRWYAMLTVAGEDGEQIEFGIVDRSKGMLNMTSERSLVFQSNAVIGELDDPYVIGFGTLGCSENGFEGALHIFPNPIERSTSYTIALPETETPRDIFVVNMMGEVVAHEANKTGLHGLQVPGVYTVRVVCHSGNVIVGKLIVK